jgi:hypothetical protein
MTGRHLDMVSVGRLRAHWRSFDLEQNSAPKQSRNGRTPSGRWVLTGCVQGLRESESAPSRKGGTGRSGHHWTISDRPFVFEYSDGTPGSDTNACIVKPKPVGSVFGTVSGMAIAPLPAPAPNSGSVK